VQRIGWNYDDPTGEKWSAVDREEAARALHVSHTRRASARKYGHPTVLKPNWSTLTLAERGEFIDLASRTFEELDRHDGDVEKVVDALARRYGVAGVKSAPRYFRDRVREVTTAVGGWRP
jgi:hypothetical protein